jgi:23S rRNA pseudouridine1911/1915/1917 synthase
MAVTFTLTAADNGQTLAAVVRARLNVSWTEARAVIARREVRLNQAVVVDAVQRVRAGQQLAIGPPPSQRSRPPTRLATVPKPKPGYAGPMPVLVYADADIVIVDKPPGLTTMRHADEVAEFGRRAKKYLPTTLADLVPGLLDGTPVLAVHRLDKDTSGLVAFARTAAAAQHLGQQFRTHTITRRYRALVRGRPTLTRIETNLVAERGDGRRGTGAGPGQRAVTFVQVLEELGPFALVECRLETGRTHQVRIHLGEHGAPLCGERVYDRPVHGQPVPDGSGAPRIALHAAVLGLTHPTGGQRCEWTAPWPADLAAVLTRLRGLAVS